MKSALQRKHVIIIIIIIMHSYLSDMATCSSIEDPVLVFQFPEIDVLLWNKHRSFSAFICHDMPMCIR